MIRVKSNRRSAPPRPHLFLGGLAIPSRVLLSACVRVRQPEVAGRAGRMGSTSRRGIRDSEISEINQLGLVAQEKISFRLCIKKLAEKRKGGP